VGSTAWRMSSAWADVVKLQHPGRSRPLFPRYHLRSELRVEMIR
jgi:hypothetical protein